MRSLASISVFSIVVLPAQWALDLLNWRGSLFMFVVAVASDISNVVREGMKQ